MRRWNRAADWLRPALRILHAKMHLTSSKVDCDKWDQTTCLDRPSKKWSQLTALTLCFCGPFDGVVGSSNI